MQNSDSIKKVVDVGLFSRLVTMFGYTNNDARWLISTTYENKEKWGGLDVCGLNELMKSCTNKKELHAIALFCWLFDFNNFRFASRVTKELAKGADVIFEAMLYNSMYCKEESDLWATLNDSLRHTERRTAIEYLIAQYALGDSAAEETKSCLCMLASSMMVNLSVEGELAIFVRCAQLAQELGNDKDMFMNAVLDSVMKVPIERGKNYAVLSGWGYDYLDQLKLSWYMQKECFFSKRLAASSAKEKKLKESLLSELVNLKRPWTDSEWEIIRSINVNERYLVKHKANMNNRMGISLVLPLELDNVDKLDLAKIFLISVSGYSDDGIRSVWKINHNLFLEALKSDSPESFNLFCRLRQAGCDGLEVFTDYWERYICDWLTAESWEWVKKHGFSEISVSKVDTLDYPFISGKKEKSLFVSMLKEYLEVWDPEKYEILFEENPNKFKIMQRWYSEEEIEAGMQLLPEEIGLYTSLAIIGQSEVADLVAGLSDDEADEAELIFSKLAGKKIKIVSSERFREVLSLNIPNGTKVAFVERGIDASVADKIPYQFLNEKIVMNDPWVLETNWCSDFALDYYGWNSLASEQKSFLAEFCGIVPLKYFEDAKCVRELYRKFSDDFEDIFKFVEAGIPIQVLLDLDNGAAVKDELFGEFAYLVEDGMPACFVMWAKEHIPDKLKKITKKSFSPASLLFDSNFYMHCDFNGVDLDDIIPCRDRVRAGMTFDKDVIKLMQDIPLDIIWIAQIANLSKKDLTLLSKNEMSIKNVDVLAFNLLQQDMSAWSKKFNVKGENLIRLISYNYRWNESTIPLADYVIDNEIIGRIDQSIKYVLRKNYVLRYVFSETKADIKSICIDVLSKAYSSESFNLLLHKMYYGSGIISKIGCCKLIDFLSDKLKSPEAGVDFMEGLDKKILKFLTGRINPLSSLKWLPKLLDLAKEDNDSVLLVWLNLIDGTWFEYKNSLYRILKDSEGYGVQCCLGEDVLDSKIRRIVPTEVCITCAPCPIIIGETIDIVY